MFVFVAFNRKKRRTSDLTQLQDMSREGDERTTGQDVKIIVEFFPELS
nr:MAG TPA: hypothetical protein [Caudoviricetes sp.]